MSDVLIVEDESAVRRLVRHWLQAEGFAVAEAGTAEEGLALANRSPAPAVALCDLRLPGHSGLWLADQLRQALPETTVVMMTGVQDFEIAVRSLQSGVIDYVAKPFSRERIQEALQRAFAAHTARRAVANMQQELNTGRMRVSEALAEVEMTTSGTIEALLRLMDAHTPGARAKATRLSGLSVNVALALEMREPDVSRVEYAALLYELDTLALSEILTHVPFLAAAGDLVTIARDSETTSSGGEDLPLGARVLSAVVAFDTLVNGATPLARGVAVEQLASRPGVLFDGRVLDALDMLHAPVVPSI